MPTQPLQWIGVKHAASWTDCLRVEARVVPSALVSSLGRAEDIITQSPNVFDGLGLADLRLLDPADPWLHPLLLAKLPTVEQFHALVINGQPAMRRVLRRKLAELAANWPWPHPSDLFDGARGRLQAELDAIMAAVR